MKTLLKRLIAVSFALVLIGAGLACGCVSAAQGKHATPVAPRAQGLSVEDVIDMVKGGVSDDVIIARLRKENKPFDLSTADMIRLTQAKVSDTVQKVMMDPQAAAPAATTPVAPMPPSVNVSLFPGATKPSGATPAAGANPQGDPDDPMTPHDSGIYLYSVGLDSKPHMTVLERAAYQGTKMGTGMLMLTGGLAKAKMKAVIPGPRASIRAYEASPTFYFYFEDKAAGLGKSYFGSNNVSNPNQFALVKLEVAKSNRETVIGKMSAFGNSFGTDQKSMVGFKSERLRAGLYKVVPDHPLEPGEYCFFASSAALGVYGAGSAGAGDIFDFGVNPTQ